VEKAPDAFRTISEVAQELDVPQHVLRFWESRFREIKPMKRGGGRRYYRPDDLDLLRGIRHLLYGEGYTIRGVQRLLREQGVRFVQSVWQPGAPQPVHRPAEEDEPSEQPGADVRVEPVHSPQLRDIDDDEQAQGPEPKLPLAAAGGLMRADAQKLQAALSELMECRRLLDTALAEQA
jgi:DNA-binding transcriptional MerR regulator